MMRLFALLLTLLPRDFRAEFGDELEATVEARWRDLRGAAGPWGALRFWWRQGLAILRAGVALRLRPARAGAYDARALTPPPATAGATDGLWQDLRYSLRALAARPGLTAVSVLTLAAGIGATAAIYGTTHAVLFRPLPYAEADRVITIFRTGTEYEDGEAGMSAADIDDLSRTSRLLSHVAVAEPWSLDLMEDGRAVSLQTWTVSPSFFEAIGAEAALGRTFTNEEFLEGAAPAVVLAHDLWEGRFGADTSLVGTTVVLDSQPHLVVGVMPASFKFPDAAAAWSPRPTQPWDEDGRGEAFMTGVARLADGVTVDQAQAEVDLIASTLAETYPDTNAGTGFELIPLREHLFGDVRVPLLTLLGAVVFVLLIACANVAGLQLARGSRRRSEFALRGALGATRGRLVRLALLESLLLATAGSALALLVAAAGVQGIAALGPDQVPRLDELRPDLSLALVAGAAAIVCAVLAGAAPAMALSRIDLTTAITETGRGATHAGRGARLRRRLVVTQVALSVVLLIGAGLLVRSFSRLTDNALGFDPEGRLATQVFVYGQSVGELRAFIAESREAIEAVPGVRAVALTSTVPLATDASISSIDVAVRYSDADLAPADGDPVAWLTIASHDYPDVLGIDVVSGRSFTSADDQGAPPVMMINETLARRHFGAESPLGGRLAIRTGETTQPVAREIVGVLRDVRPLGFESEPRPEVYLPLDQAPTRSLTYVVRADVDPASLTLPVQEAIWSVNPYEAVWAVVPMESLLGDLLRERRFNLVLLSAFAALALFLTAIGLYGLVSYFVEERMGELGIRRALGGRSGDIAEMVIREAASLAVVGIVLGLVGAAALTRVMRGMLYGVDPADPLTFVALSGAMLAVATLAALLPLRRALRADAMSALRPG